MAQSIVVMHFTETRAGKTQGELAFGDRAGPFDKEMDVSLRKCFPVLMSGVALSLVCGGAAAQDWKAVGDVGWLAVGKMHEIEKNHFYWVGEFSGTFFNDKGAGGLFHRAAMKCPGFYDFNANIGKHTGGGYCIVNDGEGNMAYLTWNEKGDTFGVGTGTFTYTGGTGKYKDIKGQNTFTLMMHAPWPDGMSSGLSSWNK